MTDLAIDQNARSNNGLDVGQMAHYPKMAVRLGDYGSGSQIAVTRCLFNDSDSLNTLYLYAGRIEISNNRFMQIGGARGRVPHDHSTIYTTATTDDSTQQISNNFFGGVRASGGAATAIETHGGSQLVVDNVIDDYLRGFNVTGVADARTTKVAVTRNRVNRAAIGIQLWSQTTAVSSSEGLANVNLSDNHLGLDGAIWRDAGIMAPTSGILLTTSNTAPVDGLTVARNHILYDSANLAPQVKPYSAGISCRVIAAEAQPKKIVIVDNTIARAPSAIDGTCLVDGALVRNNNTSG
jgi:hypothetical protein